MKTIQTIMLCSLFFSINSIFGQYGTGGYPGNGYGTSGRMNGMNGMNRGSMSNDRREPEKVSNEVMIAKVMEKLKPDLKLDELQVIAISQIMNETLKQQGVILKKETEQSEKIIEVQSLTETSDRKIMELLNKDQKEKYKSYIEDRKNRIQSGRSR